MKRTNKSSNQFLAVYSMFFLLLIAACSAMSNQTIPATYDPNLLGTIIAETANAAMTQTALHVSPTFSPTPTYINSLDKLPTATSTIFAGGYRPGDPTATPLGSEITDPNFVAGVKAFYDEDYELTIELMSAVIEANPELAPPYRYRGASYLFFGDCQSSMLDIETALSINTEYAAAWAIHAMINKCFGDEEQKFSDYQKALSIDPSLSFVHHNLGVNYYDNGDYGKALEELNLALEIDSSRALNWSSVAEALFKLGKNQECIIHATKALEIDPQYWLAYSDRAFCEDSIGNSAAALEDYKIYVEHTDFNATTWFSLGFFQRKAGDSEGAVISYSKALELDASYYAAHINRGNAYIDLEEYQKALDDFNIALEYGELPNAYSGRGDAYYGLKKYDKAIKDYQLALSLNPGNAHYYCMLSLSYFEIEEYQESINSAEVSQGIDPNCGGQRLLETEARSYYELTNYDQALVFINKALAMGEYALGHYYRGIIYQAAGKNQEAIQDLETFLSETQAPESSQDEITDAKSRLAKLKK